MRRVVAFALLITAAAALPAAARPVSPVLRAPMVTAPGALLNSGLDWPDATASWLQPGYDAGHSGFNPREKTLSKTNVANLQGGFSFPTAAEINADPIESAGTLYADSSDGNLYALSATTGAQRWTFPMTLGDWPQGIALSGSRLFVTCQIDSTHAGLCALNAKTGKKLWQWAIYDDPPSNPVGSSPYTAPVVSGNTVVLGESDTASFGHVGYLFGLDVRTGQVVWTIGNCGNGGANDCNHLGDKTPASNGASAFYGTPVVVSGLTYDDVCAVTLAGGAAEWCSLVSDPDPAVTVAGNVVYVNAFNNPQEVLYAFDAGTGAALWQHVFSDGNNEDLRPAVQGKTVYVSGGNNLYALNAKTGAQKWEVPGGAVSAPSIANGIVYAGCQGLCAYAAANGKVLWHSTGSVTRSSPASPAVVNGTLYGGCNYNNACSFHL